MHIQIGGDEHVPACISIARELQQYFTEDAICMKHVLYVAVDLMAYTVELED